ncbi:hypothetical protein McanCB49686_003141 [Microsporum canis]
MEACNFSTRVKSSRRCCATPKTLHLEVQAEINILLGNDRARAWQFIEQWRVFAIENLRHHFDLWLYIEKQIYQDDSYQLKFEPFSL